MQCPTCKQILDDSVRFCPHDGTPLTETSSARPATTPTGGARPPSRELELPVVIGNRYRLEALRGGGGMAKVYRAHDQTLDREVAVKLISPDLRNESEFDARFQREAKIASQLADPHIVVVHDFGLDPEHGPYLVMEYLQGQSLRERLATSGPMPLKAILQLAGQLFLALIHAHDKGIVHRDIKPDNIFLLNQSGVRLHTRVLDFGIARIYRRDDPTRAETITHAGAVLGTPRYMSPEQLAGRPVDARSDLYSAALVLFEALTGQLPYAQGKRLCELCPDASTALQELLELCLKPNPDDRPKTAVEVYLRLQELGKASGILLLPPGSIEKLLKERKPTDNASEPTQVYNPSDQTRRRTRRLLLLGLGMVIVLLGGLGIYLWLREAPFSTGSEKLHGIQIGDSAEVISGQLTLTKIDRGNPWKMPQVAKALGNLLKPDDLRLTESALNELTVRRTSDDSTAVIFAQDKVVAVITTAATKTNRNIHIGSEVGRVYKAYEDQKPKHEEKDLEDGKYVELRSYPALGIGFEIQGRKVTRMVLFPKK